MWFFVYTDESGVAVISYPCLSEAIAIAVSEELLVLGYKRCLPFCVEERDIITALVSLKKS